jgi:hypothetical protein
MSVIEPRNDESWVNVEDRSHDRLEFGHFSKGGFESSPLALGTWWCNLGGRWSSEVLDMPARNASPSE